MNIFSQLLEEIFILTIRISSYESKVFIVSFILTHMQYPLWNLLGLSKIPKVLPEKNWIFYYIISLFH